MSQWTKVRGPVVAVALAAVLLIWLWGSAAASSDMLLACIWAVCVVAAVLHSRGRGMRCIVEATIASVLGASICLAYYYLRPPNPPVLVRRQLLLLAPMVIACAAAAGLVFGTVVRCVAEGIALVRSARSSRVPAGPRDEAAEIHAEPAKRSTSRWLWPLSYGVLGVVLIGGAYWAVCHASHFRIQPPPLGVDDVKYEPLTPSDFAEAAEFVPTRETERLLDIPYGPHGWRNTLDLLLPKGSGGLIPVVVYFHGGGGDKEEFPRRWLLPLLDHGYAIAVCNRRHSWRDPRLPNPSNEAVAPFPAQIHDSKGAVRFLRASAEKYRLDPNRMAVMGHSEGGLLAALVAVANDVPEFESDGWHQGTSSRVQAAVVLAAPLDLRIIDKQTRLHGQCLNVPWAGIQELHVGGIPADVRGNLDKAAWASPTTYVSPDDPPVLIMSGFRDWVPPHQADYFFGLLRQAGVDAQIELVGGASHALKDNTVGPTIAGFLERQFGTKQR